MDPKAVSQQMDEATKSLKSSFAEGSTKLFGSVMDAKRGLFSGITSKFDQVANIVGSATGAGEPPKNGDAVSGSDNAAAEAVADGGSASATSGTGGRQFADGKPPPFRRRNTNPFMEGYDPNVVENEIPPPIVTGTDGTAPTTADGAPVAPAAPPSAEPSRAWDMAANAMQAVTDLLPSLPKIPSGGPSAFFSPISRGTGPATDQQVVPASKPRKKRTTEDGGESDADSDATEGCDDRAEEEDLGEGGIHEANKRRAESGSRNSNQSNDAEDIAMLDPATKDCINFMKYFVDKVFIPGEEVTAADKAKFGELCQQGNGRLWFAKYVNSQRVNSKAVPESVILALVQYVAIVLFECNEAEDYGPAKTLMNMAFTFYHEVQENVQETPNIFNKLKSLVGVKRKTYLYSYLKDQAIWQSPRFWNAAFFYAVQHERANKPATSTWSAALSNIPIPTLEQNADAKQQEITFSQLRTFTCNMRSLGVPKDHCQEFIRRQASLANLSNAQIKTLRENMEQWTEESANK